MADLMHVQVGIISTTVFSIFVRSAPGPPSLALRKLLTVEFFRRFLKRCMSYSLLYRNAQPS